MKSNQIYKRLFVVTALMLTSLTTVGICSFSYALWSGDLTIETEITTGCLDVNFCDEYSGKNIEHLELVPGETVQIWLSNTSTIPSRYAGIENEKELKKMGIRVEHGEESDKEYLDITLEKENKADPGQAFEVNILYEQENSPEKGWTEELKISGTVKIEEPKLNLQIDGLTEDSIAQPITEPETKGQDIDQATVDVTDTPNITNTDDSGNLEGVSDKLQDTDVEITENLSEGKDNTDSLQENDLPSGNQ